MMQLFASGQQNANSSDANGNREKESRVTPSQQGDYQILIGNEESTSQSSQFSRTSIASTSYRLDGQSYIQESDPNFCISTHPKLNLFLYVTFYVVFIVFGACLFTLMEQPVEMHLRDQLLLKQETFLSKHRCIDAETLENFINFVLSAEKKGVDLQQLNFLLNRKNLANNLEILQLPTQSQSQNNNNEAKSQMPKEIQLPKLVETENSNEINIQPNNTNTRNNIMTTSLKKFTSSKWGFTSSLMFVTSAVTTIGYGHVTPITDAGKVMCIIFTCIGIPATLTFLSTMVSLLIRGPVYKIEKFLLRLLSGFGIFSNFYIRILHLVIITMILLSICFFIPALIFTYLEDDWSFLDAFYFCYISLTTIGLGDFVPANSIVGNENVITLYRIFTIIYLYFGLTMIMLWLALIYRIPQFNFNQLLISKENSSNEEYERNKFDENKFNENKFNENKFNENTPTNNSSKINYGTNYYK